MACMNGGMPSSRLHWVNGQIVHLYIKIVFVQLPAIWSQVAICATVCFTRLNSIRDERGSLVLSLNPEAPPPPK